MAVPMSTCVASIAERDEIFRDVVRGITVFVMNGEEIS
jgi:hypothetical protein